MLSLSTHLRQGEIGADVRRRRFISSRFLSLSAAADGKEEITLCRRAVHRGQALSFEVRSEPG